MVGRTIAHYEVTGKLGEGGMGVVYRARDTRLDRTVALKFLPTQLGVPRGDPVRFLQEARAASALDHPNICTVHGLETTNDGEMFIVMACYEGETLQARLERGRLDVDEVVEIARQVAEGLGRAHERGIVHRDIKPSNIFITRDGLVKILDFGVSRLLDESGVTRTGSQIGTVSYMAPEQARAEAVDQRVDVWALGAVIYEMLTGRRAFDGSHAAVVLQAIQSTEPAPLSAARPDAPAALIDIVARALRKDRTQRFADGRAMAESLRALSPATLTGTFIPVAAAVRRSRIVVPLVAAIAILVAALGWLGYRWNRASWARHQALPEIARLVQAREFDQAMDLATRAERHIAGDPVLQKLWTEIAVDVTVESEPASALVEIAPYAGTAEWRALGTTPIAAVRLPKGAYRWRFSKAGFETIERGVPSGAGTMRVVLPAAGSVPAGMVLIPKATEVLMLAGFGLPEEITLDDYFVGRHEVTNREFKRFVDAGGYRRREFWKHPFHEAGKTLAWEDAMTRFRDKVGQPGPAQWEIGAYPAGAEDLPVGGVSWFEAAAYAAFAGVSLPTLHHWYRAAGITAGPFLLPLANFGDRGPRAVGTTGAMSPSGAFDMAGNVKEWVWTPTTSGLRHILGGGWGDPQYMFGQIEALTPFDRAPKNGFRVAQYSTEGPDPKSLGPFDRKVRDFVNERSVSEETFAQFARTFAYDTRAPLDARVEKTLDAAADVAVERVSFAAAYDGERVIAYVWRPRHVAPPYQTLVVFPGAEALRPAGPDVLEQPNRYDFLVRSGRAVVHPVYRGMYERFTPRWTSPIGFRQTAIRWVQDLQRTLDYLETRPDIDRRRIGYFGGSLGAGFAPVPLALEPRLQLAILIGGGLPTIDYEADVAALNYLPRVKVPTILMGGRYDYFIPYESAQRPFFERLGTRPEDKKHVVFEAPHSIPRSDYVSEMLAWLDRYFGPVR